MIKSICILVLSFLFTSISFSQLNFNNKNILHKSSSASDAGNTLILGSILAISPTLVIESGKTRFGLSKEFSAGKFPFGRAELDYAYVFRSERTNMVNLSYNFDMPLNGNFKDPSLFMISPGAGYYTDFTCRGYFAQLAIGLFASTGFSDAIAIHPNIKFRKTFMNNNQPGAFSVSLGVGFGFYSR